jgi:hypothetical protein
VNTPLEEILALQGYGLRTWQSIGSIQREAQLAAEAETSDSDVEALVSEPAGPESLPALPLFRTSTPEAEPCISPCELHKSWFVDMPVHKLPLNGGAIRALGLNDILNLGQLLMTSGRSLLQLKGVGRKALAATRAAVASTLFGSIPEGLVLDAVEPPPPDAAGPVIAEEEEELEEEPLSPFDALLDSVDIRVEKILMALDVVDLEGIYMLRPEQVMSCENSDMSTWERILLLRDLIAQEAPEVQPRRDTWACPASRDALLQLPVFTSFRPAGLSPTDLHETYLPRLPLKYLFLSGRPARLGSWTIGKILVTPADALASRGNWGCVSSEVLQGALLDVILLPSTWSDTSMPSILLDALLLEQIRGRERDSDIVRRRCGLSGTSWCTFAELGRRYGITAQGANFAFHKTMARLRSCRSLRLLAHLWLQIDALVEEQGIVPRTDELLDGLGVPPTADRAREVRALELLLQLRAPACARRTRRRGRQRHGP